MWQRISVLQECQREFIVANDHVLLSMAQCVPESKPTFLARSWAYSSCCARCRWSEGNRWIIAGSTRTRYNYSMVKAHPIRWLSHQILVEWLSASPYIMRVCSTRARYDDSMVKAHSIWWQLNQVTIYWEPLSPHCRAVVSLLSCLTMHQPQCASPISQLQCRVTLLFQWGCNARVMSHQQRLLTPLCVMLSWLCTAKGERKKGWTAAGSTVQPFCF